MALQTFDNGESYLSIRTKINANFTELFDRIGVSEGDISVLQGQLSTLDGDLTTLGGRVTTAEGDINTIDGRVDEVVIDIGELSSAVGLAEVNIGTLQTTITNLTDSGAITHFKVLSQTEYDELATKDETTIYFVKADAEPVFNMYINNEVQNATFLDTTGWVVTYCSITATDNVLQITGSGSADSTRIRQESVDVDALEGDKVFMFMKARDLSGLATQLSLRTRMVSLASDYTVATIDNPIQNEWYEIYDIFTITSGNYGIDRVQLYTYYGSSADALNSVTEVQGDKADGGEVFAINLSKIDRVNGTAYSTMTAEEINAIKYQES